MNNDYSSVQLPSPIPQTAHSKDGEYVLATGAGAVGRLLMLHDIYSPAGRRVLLRAGLKPGMRVADFGCGIGAVTRMLGEMVGASGSVTGIDANRAQLEQAADFCRGAGLTNVTFQEADACATGLPRETFDLVYCRFLLLHLTDPAACLREMRHLLKPGGILVVEDGDIASAGSIPHTVLDTGVEYFLKLGRARGLNYSLARDLYHLVKAAGFEDAEIEIHQPALTRGERRRFLTWCVEEAGPSFLAAGLLTSPQLERLLAAMNSASADPNVLILSPRMSLVWARKDSQGFDRVV